MIDITTFAARIDAVNECIHRAAHRARRDPSEVTLVAVTKTHAADIVAQAIAAGLQHLGENRLQEASQKIEALHAERASVHWHLIGHLQRNKARRAVHLFDMVHSLDSVRLAEALNRHMHETALDTRQGLPVLLQVNVSGEASKEGFWLEGGRENAEQWQPFLAEVERVLALPYLRVQGLMTVAPLLGGLQAARPVFRRLRHLRDALAHQFPTADWSALSMGMTNDFEVAIEEGATHVRVGRALFGERPANT
jgi:hypothetical protein